ncbi:helix-turn-helix domain-containing protein [Paramagnetospirillum kuznetsovii]|uniref:helix-turn-helix domain-containing protein n=1 Tax=Paramagnetospirillum kuznetsovii TaxID=2053833 RepID=UPI0011BEAE10|nr:helix-turn-helix domain-containing protein [Paramagnetospirillum kuznetsovii]
MSSALAAREEDEEAPDSEQPSASAPVGGWTSEPEGEPFEQKFRPKGNAKDIRAQVSRLSDLARNWPDAAKAARGFGQSVLSKLQALAAQYLPHPRAEVEQSRSHSAFGGAAEADPLPQVDPAEAKARIDFILQRLPPKGDPSIPGNLSSLALLLADQPACLDFQAVDLLHDCFPRGTRNSDSRLLMAVARNVTRNFGQPGRLPISSGKAWTMLDPDLFNDEMAAQLAAICNFVRNWQTTQSSFLILEFAEIELIEYLFENMHPVRHASLLLKVMEFKVLSARRVGLLRRIPARVRRFVQNPGGRSAAVVRTYVDDTISLLNTLTGPEHFAAVSMAARIALAELEKIVAQMETAALPALSLGTVGGAAPLHPVMRGLGDSGGGASAVAPAVVAPPAASSLPVTQIPRSAAMSGGQKSPSAGRRLTKKQKTEAVMRVLHGEEPEWVALSVGVSPKQVSMWRDAFLDGGNAALGKTQRKAQSVDPSIDELKDKLQSLIKTVEHLSSRIAETASAPEALPAPKTPAVIPLPGPKEEVRAVDKVPLALPAPTPPPETRRKR